MMPTQFDKIINTPTKGDVEMARMEKMLTLREKSRAVEKAEEAAPSERAAFKLSEETSKMQLRNLPLAEQAAVAETQKKIKDTALAMKDSELTDLAVMLGNVRTQEQYDSALGAMADRYGPDFNPQEFGLGPTLDARTKANMKYVADTARDNLPHVRAKELANRQLAGNMAVEQYKQKTNKLSTDQLRAMALAKRIANQNAASAGGEVPYQLTSDEDALADGATKDTKLSIAMQAAMGNMQAFQALMKGDTAPFMQAVAGASNQMDLLFTYKSLSPTQMTRLQQARAAIAANPKAVEEITKDALKFGISKELLFSTVGD
jgi:hypothetical protein